MSLVPRLAAAFAALALALPLPAAAGIPGREPLVSDYQAATGQAREALQHTVYDEFNGLLWANAVLRANKQGQLFCRPSDLRQGPDDVLAIFDAFIAGSRVQNLGQYPVGLVLLKAMQDHFPCKPGE
jgi:hypothetical protein